MYAVLVITAPKSYTAHFGIVTFGGLPYICSVKKILTLIFSFYLLALAVMPCSDKDDCKYHGSEQSTFATTDHSDHDSDTENCSPSCMCACCGQSMTNIFYPTALYNLTPFASQDFLVYNASFVSEVYLSIWQPPKIS
ncbi:hypothetical protein L6Q79_00615 [bacterium]|nr:hypothetical protein [bacterium]NUN45760.1 hypothetical protein [bacterium]